MYALTLKAPCRTARLPTLRGGGVPWQYEHFCTVFNDAPELENIVISALKRKYGLRTITTPSPPP